MLYQEVEAEADEIPDDRAKSNDSTAQVTPDNNDELQEKADYLEESNITEEPPKEHEKVLETLNEVDGGWKSFSAKLYKVVRSSLMCDNSVTTIDTTSTSDGTESSLKEHSFLFKGGLMGDSICIDEVEIKISINTVEVQVATTKPSVITPWLIQV